MEGLKIIEYTPSYAKAVAEMWQKSTEGWNGENGNKTEETVLAEHAASANINTYLAVLGDEVLGYCGFSRYRDDEGALYISTLNARYDYHGKGIGKTLVKKAVERTIELSWPRLDLYTWSANTKSIPLYKRCGFFLENRQDTTHLMNFIPLVMQTEAVKNYFAEADWYDDMKRTIDIEPDGKIEQGFEFYEYNWDRNGKKLRMEFERRGRGLRLIETDDYMVSLFAASQNLVFGQSYKAVYEIVNKTGKPLNVEIVGLDDKNIKFSLNKKVRVVDKEVVEGEFYISELDYEISKFKTHPGVAAEVVINGMKALFKLGIVPKSPAKISLSCKDVKRYRGECFIMYIDIENNLDEYGIFQVEIPKCSDIEFTKRFFKIQLETKQKISIPIECTMKNPCIYQAEIIIKASLQSGLNIQFQKKAAVMLRDNNSALGGEIEGKYIIVNGKYELTLDKGNNKVEVFIDGKKSDTYFMYPKLGRPYSQEFSNMLVKNVSWYYENEKMFLSYEYISDDFKNIIVKSIFNISNNGMFQHYYELRNTSDIETADNICVNQSLHYGLSGAVIPYNNKIIEVTEPGMNYYEYYDSEKISGNWIYANRGDETESIIWPQNLMFSFDSWFINLEHNVGKLKGGERRITEPVYFAISTFKNYCEVRKFALKSNSAEEMCAVEDYEIDINSGNPFVYENFDINISEHRNFSNDGSIIVTSKNGCFDQVSVKTQGNLKNTKIPINTERGIGNDLIFIETNFSSINFQRKAPVFYIKNMKFKSQITKEMGLTVYSISNGVLNIKASPEFSAGIFSLEFMDKEWLDSSFPKAFPRAWYNPFFGGIQDLPEVQMENARSLLKEHIYNEFVEKVDVLGNMWKGIKTSMDIAHNEECRGLKMNQYFLMLPGVPVILHLTELENKMGKYMNSFYIANSGFYKIDEEIRENWVSVKTFNNDVTRYRAGAEEYELRSKSSLLYGCDDLSYKIQVYMNSDAWENWALIDAKDFACMNRINISLASDEKRFLPGKFYIFTKEHMSDKSLKGLKKVRFE